MKILKSVLSLIWTKNKASKKNKIKLLGKDNKIFIFDDKNENLLSKEDRINGIKISVLGDGNIIRISKNVVLTGCSLVIIGNNNFFEIGDGLIEDTSFIIQKSNDSQLVIASGIFIGSAKFLIEEPKTYIKIGKNCMFSDNIMLRNSDGHPIYDKQGILLNRAKGIVIGNHVWLGCNTTILKNVVLADDIIVGAGSVVTKSFDKTGVILAGVPAKVVKEDVSWNNEFIGEIVADE